MLLNTMIGLPDIRDTQCGFKFFQVPYVARDLFARQRIDGYMFDVEILMLAVRAQYTHRGSFPSAGGTTQIADWSCFVATLAICSMS